MSYSFIIHIKFYVSITLWKYVVYISNCMLTTMLIMSTIPICLLRRIILSSDSIVLHITNVLHTNLICNDSLIWVMSNSLPDIEDFKSVTFMGAAQMGLLIWYRLVWWLTPFAERWDGTSDHNFITKRRIVRRI